MWTKAQLHSLVEEQIGKGRFIVVSNREPFIHDSEGDRIVCKQPAGGLTSALHPIMSASGGTWIARSSGTADHLVVDSGSSVLVPPDNPTYRLKRVWIEDELGREYYNGLANQGLWPLCHNVYRRPRFCAKEWASYRKVNAMFADAVLEEARDEPAFVFVQDYHFALLPQMLKRRNPRLVIAQFWHIPWPSRDTIAAFPWKTELLEGMLGNDLLGFQLRRDSFNFLSTVDRGIEARVDLEHQTVARHGRTTRVQAFPISIDFDAHSRTASGLRVQTAMRDWREKIGPGVRIGVGIDRVDYTKGIPERIRGLDLLLERNPGYRGKLVFVQVGVPSRSDIPEYGTLAEEIDAEITRVNAKWRTPVWEPVLYVKRHLGAEDMMALHRLASFCLVTPLHDGMNLVAKEFVASRTDLNGALVLSEFAGAASELTSAVLVNPFSEDEIAAAIETALTLSPRECAARMSKMRATVERNNIYRWGGKLLSALFDIEPAESDGTARTLRPAAHAAKIAVA